MMISISSSRFFISEGMWTDNFMGMSALWMTARVDLSCMMCIRAPLVGLGSSLKPNAMLCKSTSFFLVS